MQAFSDTAWEIMSTFYIASSPAFVTCSMIIYLHVIKESWGGGGGGHDYLLYMYAMEEPLSQPF